MLQVALAEICSFDSFFRDLCKYYVPSPLIGMRLRLHNNDGIELKKNCLVKMKTPQYQEDGENPWKTHLVDDN